MPYKLYKVGNHYEVINTETGKVLAKHTSVVRGLKQIQLLYMKDAYKEEKKGSKL